MGRRAILGSVAAAVLSLGLTFYFAGRLLPLHLRSTAAPARSANVTAWAIVLQATERLDKVRDDNPTPAILGDLVLLDFAIKVLQSESEKKPSAGATPIRHALGGLQKEIADFQKQQDDATESPATVVSLPRIVASCGQLEKLYDPLVLKEARQLAQAYQCPMHPDITGAKGDMCPKCGMPLTARVRLSVADVSGSVRLPRIVKARTNAETQLEVGVPVRCHLDLWGPGNEPLTLEQLTEVHTKKIHLLIIDGSLADYHHEHPVLTNTPGHYDFEFTPRKPGSYYVWADLQPVVTGIQEYVLSILPAVSREEPLRGTKDSFQSTMNDLGYRLEVKQPVRAGETALLSIRVTQADGTGFGGLEPVMGAFAHLVGFHENHTTVLHIHPEITRAPEAGERGGPNLRFRLFAPLPGYYRLFLQVQRDGKQEFVPFGINVAEGTTPWIDQEPPHSHLNP